MLSTEQLNNGGGSTTCKGNTKKTYPRCRRQQRDILVFLIASVVVYLAISCVGSTIQWAVVNSKNSKLPRKGIYRRKNKNNDFIVTFVGDTLLANMAHNWEIEEWGFSSSRTMKAGFVAVQHLLAKSDFIVMNLEGPISDLPLSSDPKHRKYSFSFGMDPDVASVLKQELGVASALNLANNHVADRGNQGYQDTKKYLDQQGLSYFGTGFTPQTAAEPLFINLPYNNNNNNNNNKRLSITSFMGTPSFCCDTLLLHDDDDDEKVHITLRPNRTDAKLALDVLEEKGGADYKLAFVHWIQNYKSVVSDETRDAAKQLVDSGFDYIIGSAGSHTVKEFDWVAGRPVLYDIGNFVFMKPGYWYKADDEGRKPMTYGTVVHMIIDDDGPRELEIHCTQNDQDKVRYTPRVCTKDEADELFNNLGPYIDFKKGDIMARVDLRNDRKMSDATSGLTARSPVKKETWNVREGNALENIEMYKQQQQQEEEEGQKKHHTSDDKQKKRKKHHTSDDKKEKHLKHHTSDDKQKKVTKDKKRHLRDD
jgi:hypothetical protein